MVVVERFRKQDGTCHEWIVGGDFKDVLDAFSSADPLLQTVSKSVRPRVAEVVFFGETYQIREDPYLNIYHDGPQGLVKLLEVHEPVEV